MILIIIIIIKKKNTERLKKRWTDLIKEDIRLPVVTTKKYAKEERNGETI